ncbi:MAG: RRXRR domain-containing protein [Chloroflexota bacterium]
MITLGIDYGASNVGIALVRNTEEGNEPLFAGTIILDARSLKEKSENRAALRRLRRTRKTKHRRLRELQELLLSLGCDPALSEKVVKFCERRGFKYGDVDKLEEEDLTYRIPREEFFLSLEAELNMLVPSAQLGEKVLHACEKILNRKGDPRLEVRPIRIDNRGVNRCAWEECSNVTPKRENAMSDALMQALVNYFQGALKENPSRIDTVKQAVEGLNKIARSVRVAADKDAKAEVNILVREARKILRGVRSELTDVDPSDERAAKKWKGVEQNVVNILKSGEGRNRYCREHSKEYIARVLAGKAIDFKKSISESDIISRREQIAFSKIWRYIEARLLPLAPEGIDRIVVERTAFDLIHQKKGGKGKKKKQTSDQTSDQMIEEIYQMGPMYGFKSRREMLTTEFGGLCAYCGKPSNELVDCDHIQPRRDFFFDSYLNIVPACPQCNAEKSKRRLKHTSLHINGEAYEKYDLYLRGLKTKGRPLHFLHYEKKGILNLMRNPERNWETDRYLGLVANNFASIVQSQRGPRPFARFLYSKIGARQRKEPKIDFRSGRHTALYRTVAYPDFDKVRDKSGGGTANHALDAILLASRLPDLHKLEARGLNVHNLGTWRRSVLSKTPKPGPEGIPLLPAHDWCVPGFESVDDNGYVSLEMACMNWNQKDSATHKQDPYGWSERASKPTKRASAIDLYEKLVKEKNEGKVKNIIEDIHHPALRMAMDKAFNATKSGPAVAEAMKKWLQEQVKKSLSSSSFTRHPADQRRRRDLADFTESSEAKIPQVIGIKRFDRGVGGKIDLVREDPAIGKAGHRYMTQPANKAVVLAYPLGANGKADPLKPCTVGVRQNFALKTHGEKIFKPKPQELEEGIVWGRDVSPPPGWKHKLEAWLLNCGFHSYVQLTPCCVVCYEDGTQRFIRNFDDSKDFKKRILKEIVGVRRTPFASRVEPLKILTTGSRKA